MFRSSIPFFTDSEVSPQKTGGPVVLEIMPGSGFPHAGTWEPGAFPDAAGAGPVFCRSRRFLPGWGISLWSREYFPRPFVLREHFTGAV